MPPETVPPSKPLLRSPRMNPWLIESSAVQTWESIYSMPITSDECVSEVRSILNCRSKIQSIRNLRGNEAQNFVDFLDQVSTSSLPCLNDSWSRTGAHSIVPGQQIPASGYTASLQDLQSPRYHPLLIYSSNGSAYRGGPSLQQICRCDRRRILRKSCGHQATQDEREL